MRTAEQIAVCIANRTTEILNEDKRIGYRKAFRQAEDEFGDEIEAIKNAKGDLKNYGVLGMKWGEVHSALQAHAEDMSSYAREVGNHPNSSDGEIEESHKAANEARKASADYEAGRPVKDLGGHLAAHANSLTEKADKASEKAVGKEGHKTAFNAHNIAADAHRTAASYFNEHSGHRARDIHSEQARSHDRSADRHAEYSKST